MSHYHSPQMTFPSSHDYTSSSSSDSDSSSPKDHPMSTPDHKPSLPPSSPKITSESTASAQEGKKKKVLNGPPLPRGSACLICRKRKLRCDGTRPRCGTCSRLGHACGYGDPAHEKLGEYCKVLEGKLESMEREMQLFRQQQNDLISQQNHNQPPPPPQTQPPSHYPSYPNENHPPSQPTQLPPLPSISSSFPPSAPQLRQNSISYQSHLQPPPSYNIDHTQVGGNPTHNPLAHPFSSLPSPSYGGSGRLQKKRSGESVGSNGGGSSGASPASGRDLGVIGEEEEYFGSGGNGGHGYQRYNSQGQGRSYRSESFSTIDGGRYDDYSSNGPSNGVNDWVGILHEDFPLRDRQLPQPNPIRKVSSPSAPPQSMKNLMNPLPSQSQSLLPPPARMNGLGGSGSVGDQSEGSISSNSPRSTINSPETGERDRRLSSSNFVDPAFGPPAPLLNSGVNGHGMIGKVNGSGEEMDEEGLPLRWEAYPPGTWKRKGNSISDGHGGVMVMGGVGEESEIAGAYGPDLPSSDMVTELVKIFFDTVNVQFPMLHYARFSIALHHGSIKSKPSLALVYSMLAIAAPYHSDPAIQAIAPYYYSQARENFELASSSIKGSKTIATVTVEMVQACCLLALIETGNADNQRAYMTIGVAARISCMLGLHRMDDDRLNVLENGHPSGHSRLQPPALHTLPDDPLLLEECRRTMWTVFCLDRWDSACVGWSHAIDERQLRLLLPCPEASFQNSTCTPYESLPVTPPADGVEEYPPLSAFAYNCRIALMGGRISMANYRPKSTPNGGPYSADIKQEAETVQDLVEMDKVMTRLTNQVMDAAQKTNPIHPSWVMVLLAVHATMINLHHLHMATEPPDGPYDPSRRPPPGSAEYSFHRCMSTTKMVYDLLTNLTMYDNLTTSLRRSRITPFTVLPPYALYYAALPGPFLYGDWQLLGFCAERISSMAAPARVLNGSSRGSTPEEELDWFGPALDGERVKVCETINSALSRIGERYPLGVRFALLSRGSIQKMKAKLSQRTFFPAQPHYTQH